MLVLMVSVMEPNKIYCLALYFWALFVRLIMSSQNSCYPF